MTKVIVFTTYLVATIIATECYKILGLFPSLDRNNFVTYRELLRELANRNHEVTVFSHFQITNPPESYKEVLLSDNRVMPNGLSYESVIANEIWRVPFETLVSTKAGNDDCKKLLKNHQLLHILRTRHRFDVIIVESFNSDCGLAVAANLSAPFIAFNPQPIQPWHYNRAGINFNSAFVPQSSLLYGRDPWFFDRLKSYVLYHITNWVYYVGSQVTDHVHLYKYLGNDLANLESIASNASLVFVNTHQSVYGGVARADNVIDIGGIHVRPPKILPAEVGKFIREAEHGVIYVNLGSTVKDSTLPEDKLNALLSTFRKLPLRILWKWDGSNIENLPSNVMTMRWLPQYDVLSNDNVKVFVSRADILSSIEALDTGKPVVAIPLFGDQFGNAAALRDAGIATIVPFQNLNTEYFLDAIDDTLGQSYQQQAQLVSNLWHDRPMSALDSAVYWTEYVARHQGAPNLPNQGNNLPIYQQLQIDVLAFIAIITYIIIYVFYKILSVLCCCCCQSEDGVEEDTIDLRRSKRVKFE